MDDIMNQCWWLFDATILALMVLCVWNGWERGLARTVAGLVAYGLAGVLAGLLVTPTTNVVYERVVRPYCVEKIEEKLDAAQLNETLQSVLNQYGIVLDSEVIQEVLDAPEDAADHLYDAASAETGIPAESIEGLVQENLNAKVLRTYTGLPEWMGNALLSSDNTEGMDNRLAETAAILAEGDAESSAESLCDNFIQPVVTQILRIFLFSFWFLLISLALHGIIRILYKMKEEEIFSTMDRGIGAGIGVAKGLVFVVLICKITTWLMKQGGDSLPFYNSEVIEKTLIFQGIYTILK